jgi:hypothetical protein
MHLDIEGCAKRLDMHLNLFSIHAFDKAGYDSYHGGGK